MHEPSTAGPAREGPAREGPVREGPVREGPVREGIAERLLVPAFWGALSIVAMWLAVLFVGIFGGNMTFASSGNGPTIIPSAVALALFAVIGTASIAKRVFGRRDAG
jgi:uncharacterized RDD family membrane protein YckC